MNISGTLPHCIQLPDILLFPFITVFYITIISQMMNGHISSCRKTKLIASLCSVTYYSICASGRCLKSALFSVRLIYEPLSLTLFIPRFQLWKALLGADENQKLNTVYTLLGKEILALINQTYKSNTTVFYTSFLKYKCRSNCLSVYIKGLLNFWSCRIISMTLVIWLMVKQVVIKLQK